MEAKESLIRRHLSPTMVSLSATFHNRLQVIVIMINGNGKYFFNNVLVIEKVLVIDIQEMRTVFFQILSSTLLS